VFKAQVAKGILEVPTGGIEYSVEYWGSGCPESHEIGSKLLAQLRQTGMVQTFDEWTALYTKSSLPRLLNNKEVSERGMELRRAGQETTRYSAFQIVLLARTGSQENEMFVAATNVTFESWGKNELGQLQKFPVPTVIPMTYVFRLEDGKYKIDRTMDNHPLVKIVDSKQWSRLQIRDAQNLQR
jgi:hypothetical protein